MKTKALTETEKRIFIAEAAGWVKVRQHWEKGGESAYCNDSHAHKQLPDYLHSLDAISGVVIDSDPLTAAKTTHELGKIADAHGVTFCECLPEWWAEAYAKARNLW